MISTKRNSLSTERYRMELKITKEAKVTLQNVFELRHPKLKKTFYKLSKKLCGRNSYSRSLT